MAKTYDRDDTIARLYDDLSAEERRRRTRHIGAIDVLAWIVLLTLAAGVALILAVNSGLVPESMLGRFARTSDTLPTPQVVTTQRQSNDGSASLRVTGEAAAPAADAPPQPAPAEPDVILSNPEAVGADTAQAAVPEAQPTPSEAESGMGGGAGMACDAAWSQCQAVDIVPLAAPRAEIAAPESDAGWGRGGGSGVQPQPTPDSEHKDFGSGGGSGQACDASWSNCEVTP